ncbi:hypothetical protein ANCCEY_11414 [Ancylostoma ceylanicum]|uniref:Carbohydrate sulfotransferase n=1 Tax=Ancylostoma ceylanicum TaxID=53326 RepID=A0A0D6LE83_9BILA|nr:hypothetical protein ANCCEY_11414 [Ancylostoma ceylanicum]
MSPETASQSLKTLHIQAPRVFIVACAVCLYYWHSGTGTIQTVEQIKNGTYDTGPFNRSDLIAPFIRYRETFQVAPAYNLSSCQIEKVMTTISNAVFCYITNASEFVANSRRISTEKYSTRLCLNQNFYENFTAVQELLGTSKTEYTIVRDPVSRFLSGFVNKCIGPSSVRDVRDIRIYPLRVIEPKDGLNGREHLYNYKILRYKEGKHGIPKLSHELDAIYKAAHVPEEIRQEIHKELCCEFIFE